MLYVITSILVLTLAVYLLNKKLPWKICPICAGVTLTWGWMLGGMWLGFLPADRYEFIIAVLMGSSIGGIVTELKKIFPKLKNKNSGSGHAQELEKQMEDCC